MPNTSVPAAAEGVERIADMLMELRPDEVQAVNVVLHCFLCPRFRECETARQLVAEPLLLVDHIAKGEMQ